MYLVINPGSTSLKYSLFDGARELVRSENIDLTGTSRVNKEFLESHVGDLAQYMKIVVRVVHGGSLFLEPICVSPQSLQKLRELSPLAPLHNPPACDLLATLISVHSDVWAVFDTAFHATIPQYASTYALPYSLSESAHIKRYGFHGISHKYVSRKLREELPNARKIISLHLGGGVSATAILDGESVDTSMGFTPRSGLVMRTRSGDIDPGIITYLEKNMNMSLDDIDHLLTQES